MSIQKCPANGITAFPLELQNRPTLEDYEKIMEVISMDFQWGPLSSGLAPENTGNHVILQKDDKSSSVIYKSIRYTVDSVQIALASHSKWLISDPVSANKEDIIITLMSTDTKSNDMFIVIVIPIIRSDSGPQPDPAYLANVRSTTSSPYDLGSCLPPKTGPNTGNVIFAMYSTCINGYTERADTRNVYVLVSTSGINVTNRTMDRIIGTTVLTRSTGAGASATTALTEFIYKPPIFSQMIGGRTSINISDFPQYITATRYLTDTTTEKLIEERKQNANQYKCMEIDPDAQVDANGNMIIDDNGDITDLTLNDIKAEREVLKNIVAPQTTDSTYKRMVGKIIEYVIAMIIIIIIAGVIYVGIFDKGDKIYGLAAFGICFCFFLATILGLVGYKTNAPNLYIGSYVCIGVGALAFLIWLPMWWNSSQAAAAATVAGTVGTAGTAVAGSGAGTQPVNNLASFIAKIPVYGIVAVISLLGGFVIGSLY